MFAITRLMLITQNNQFALRLKQALERDGQYQVVTFTTVANALVELQAATQDIVLVDMTLPGVNPTRIVQTLRDLQPDTAIVAAPNLPEVHDYAERLQLNGVVDYTARARQVLKVLEDARQQVYDAQPDTAQAPAIVDEDTVTIQESDIATIQDAEQKAAKKMAMELIFSDDDNGDTTIHFSEEVATESSMFRQSDNALEIFNKLAAEEPPLPSVEEGGTISDLMNSMADSKNLKQVTRKFNMAGEVTPVYPDALPEDSRAIPAVQILEDATDESTPLDNFSVEQFLNRVQAKMEGEGLEIRPLPSWIPESEKYVREPDFLTDQIQELYSSQPLEYTSPSTVPSEGNFIEVDAGNLSTDVNIPIQDVPPITLTDPIRGEEAEANYPVIESPNPEIEAAAPDAESTDISEEAVLDEDTPITPELDNMPVEEALPADTSYAAQLALSLTQVSLESTAESTVLIQNGEIVAHAGELHLEDIEAIRDAVEGDWEADPEQGRVRFLTMPGTGMDYMLYSRGLEDGFTLALIFSGTKPLHAIRRQGKRMAEALTIVPQVEPEPVPTAPDVEEVVPEPVDAGPLTPVTLVLALRDPEDTMADALRRLLSDGIRAQIEQRGWQVHALDVQEDLVYLFVDAPESDTSLEHISTLKEIATGLMQQQFPGVDERVWADAYMVLRPGREMSYEERQDFIHFLRM